METVVYDRVGESTSRLLAQLNEQFQPAVEFARRRLDVGAHLAEQAPRPVIVHTDGGGSDGSALSTLLLAQLLPGMTGARDGAHRTLAGGDANGNGNRSGDQHRASEAVRSAAQGAVQAAGEAARRAGPRNA